MGAGTGLILEFSVLSIIPIGKEAVAFEIPTIQNMCWGDLGNMTGFRVLT